jgi:hypothetical protein
MLLACSRYYYDRFMVISNDFGSGSSKERPTRLTRELHHHAHAPTNCINKRKLVS